MVTNAFNKYSIFAGATTGAAIYATTTFLTPATMGAITFAVSSFFASLIGAVAAVALGYALPILASMIVGALLAVAFNALYNAMKSKATVTEHTALNGDAGNEEVKQEGTSPVVVKTSEGEDPVVVADAGNGEGERPRLGSNA